MSCFDPDLWIVLPDGRGLHRDDLGPCPGCGGAAFELRRCKVRRPGGEWAESDIVVACPACVPIKGARKDRETGELVRTEDRPVSRMDAITGAVTAEGRELTAWR